MNETKNPAILSKNSPFYPSEISQTYSHNLWTNIYIIPLKNNKNCLEIDEKIQAPERLMVAK